MDMDVLDRYLLLARLALQFLHCLKLVVEDPKQPGCTSHARVSGFDAGFQGRTLQEENCRFVNTEHLTGKKRFCQIPWSQLSHHFDGSHKPFVCWRVFSPEKAKVLVFSVATVRPETGEPLLLATTDFDRRSSPSAAGRKIFYDLYRGADIPLVTAPSGLRRRSHMSHRRHAH